MRTKGEHRVVGASALRVSLFRAIECFGARVRVLGDALVAAGYARQRLLPDSGHVQALATGPTLDRKLSCWVMLCPGSNGASRAEQEALRDGLR